MTTHVVERVLWCATACCTLLGASRWRATERALVRAPAPMTWAAPDEGMASDSARMHSVVAATELLADRDPFTPPGVPVASPPQPTSSMPAADRPPVMRPALVLKGIVGGAPRWRAVIEGVPGTAGSTLVQQGDTVGGLRVRRVGADTVVVQGADTTWRLTVRRHWQ